MFETHYDISTVLQNAAEFHSISLKIHFASQDMLIEAWLTLCASTCREG